MSLALRHWIALLLGLPLLLWLFVALYLLRMSTLINSLIKVFGPWIIFGVMVLFPLAAVAICGRNLVARRRDRLNWFAVVVGSVLILASVGIIGAQIARNVAHARSPKNPSTPRVVEPPSGLAVFPGAEGFGTRTSAGRGGRLIEVTSLDDHGPGTLREALDTPGPRIIVFRVSGTIELADFLHVARPFVTIAGQTAPGDGICLKNAGLVISTHDALIQHLRVRPGDQGAIEPDDNDAIALLGRHGRVEGASNVVLDHISASWSEDEVISTWFGAHDITVSWCIVSEALQQGRHHKGKHSAGLLVGDGSYQVSLHHNLLAHNGFRNPLIIGGGTHDVVNNVVYDWGVLPAEVVDYDANSFLNFVGNYFLRGPSTETVGGEIKINSDGGKPRLFVQGNVADRGDATIDDNWQIVSLGYGAQVTAPRQFRDSEPFSTYPIVAVSAAEARELVLARAGATLPARDVVDLRIADEVRIRRGAIIDSPSQVGGYPKLTTRSPPADSDHDGMPDAWEQAHGLDPQNPADGNQDRNSDGYTNIEEYLHSLLR